MGSLLAYENEFGIIMVSPYTHEAQISKHTHFPADLRILEGIIPMCDHFEATLVSHLGTGGSLWGDIGTLWVDFGATLSDYWACGLTLESLWSHLRHMMVTLGDFRCLGSHCGPTWGPL